MQLPPDFGASRKPLNDEDIQKLVELEALKAPKTAPTFDGAGASDSWDDPESVSAGSKQSSSTSIQTPVPGISTSLGFKEPAPIVVPENDERTRLLSLIEQSKLNSDKELADAKKSQADKDNMAAILGGVNLFSSGMASQNAGSKIDVDKTYNDKLIADGAAGVEGAKVSRDSKLKDLMGNYDRLREGMTDKRNAAADQRLLNNDKFDRIYKQKQLDISAANAAASREIASQARSNNLDIRKQSLKLKQDNEKRLSNKQTEDMTKIDNTLDAINYVKNKKKELGTDTGLLSFGLNKLGSMTNMDDADKSTFKASVQDMLSERIRELSGTAASAQERVFIQENMPSVYDNDSTFDKKLQRIQDYTNTRRSNTIKNLKIQDKDVSAFEATQASPNNEKVRVIDSNGRVGTIPKANLEKALAKGYKVAE